MTKKGGKEKEREKKRRVAERPRQRERERDREGVIEKDNFVTPLEGIKNDWISAFMQIRVYPPSLSPPSFNI